MASSAYSRLQLEYKKEIDLIKEKIKQWEKFTSDYEIVQNKLKTLPKKLSHDVMVPLGTVAYMPGKLYHTNEVLVLLGDNWFTKCTADHAWGIAERRKKYTIGQLQIEREQLKEIEARYSFTEGVQEANQSYTDIREEYDEEQELKWKEAHKKKVQNEKRETIQERSQVKTHSDVWNRLEELEKEEEKELSSGNTDNEHVKGRPSSDNERIKGRSSSDNQMDSFLLSKTTVPTIVFKHTENDKVQYRNQDDKNGNRDDKNGNWNENDTVESVNQLTYETPGDIYRQQNRMEGNSVSYDMQENEEMTDKKISKTVKWASDINKDNALLQDDCKLNQRSSQDGGGSNVAVVTQHLSPVVAFSGKVIEHDATSISNPQAIQLKDGSNYQNKPKRISKFKAEKSKRS